MATSKYVIGVVVGVIFGAVAGTGVSWAAIPDSSGIIHGCYNNSGTAHALKVIDTATTSKCPGGYTALNWNQTGRQGPQGPPGASHGYQATSTRGISCPRAPQPRSSP
jgi:hypothetical protein